MANGQVMRTAGEVWTICLAPEECKKYSLRITIKRKMAAVTGAWAYHEVQSPWDCRGSMNNLLNPGRVREILPAYHDKQNNGRCDRSTSPWQKFHGTAEQVCTTLLSLIAFSGYSIAKASHLATTPPLAADDCYSYCLADLSLQPWQDGG